MILLGWSVRIVTRVADRAFASPYYATMRFAYFVITLTLIGALVAPFYLKGPSGAPLMSWDRVVEDNTPQVLVDREAYRWQDDTGQWHFSDQPLQEQAERFEIQHSNNTLESRWIREAQAAAEAEAAAGGKDVGGGLGEMLNGTELSFPQAYSGEALDKAKAAAKLLEERGEVLDQLMQSK